MKNKIGYSVLGIIIYMFVFMLTTLNNDLNKKI